MSIQIERDSVHVGRDYMEEGDLYTVRCVKGLPKCGSLEYNHDTHYCTKEKRVEEQPMCGSAKFNPEKSFCYSDGKIYSKCGDGNGGLVEYNPKNEFCGEKMRLSNMDIATIAPIIRNNTIVTAKNGFIFYLNVDQRKMQ